MPQSTFLKAIAQAAPTLLQVTIAMTGGILLSLGVGRLTSSVKEYINRKIRTNPDREYMTFHRGEKDEYRKINDLDNGFEDQDLNPAPGSLAYCHGMRMSGLYA